MQCKQDQDWTRDRVKTGLPCRERRQTAQPGSVKDPSALKMAQQQVDGDAAKEERAKRYGTKGRCFVAGLERVVCCPNKI